MKRFAILLCLICFSATSTVATAAMDINQLMQDLAQKKSGHAKFVERKYISLLDKPVVSSGELFFTAPSHLEKRTLAPKPELITLDNDTLSIEFGGKKYSLLLSSRPEAIAFVDSIRGTLCGNRQMLEANYALLLSGTREKWSLRLLPSNTDIAALLTRIDIQGERDQITRIEYLLVDGDRTVMNLTPIEGGK